MIKGISGAICNGKKPTARAVMLGKMANSVAPLIPKKIVAKKSAALTSGPVTACTPKKRREDNNKRKN